MNHSAVGSGSKTRPVRPCFCGGTPIIDYLGINKGGASDASSTKKRSDGAVPFSPNEPRDRPTFLRLLATHLF